MGKLQHVHSQLAGRQARMQLHPKWVRTAQEVEAGDVGRDGGPLQEDKNDEERLGGCEHRLQVREALHHHLHHCAVSTTAASLWRNNTRP